MRFVILLAVLLGFYVVATSLRMAYLARVSGRLIEEVTPYEQQPAAPQKRILIVGDSTAYGTGTSDSKYSVAGRLGEAFPNAEITNRSRNGLRTEDLARELEVFLGDADPYDFIVLHIGANDVLRLRSLERETRPNLEAIIKRASEQGSTVAWYTSGKIGEAPFFPAYLKPLMNARSLALRDTAKDIAARHENVLYVDLVIDGKDVLASDPDAYYSADGLHPSDAGYGIWFHRLMETVDSL